MPFVTADQEVPLQRATLGRTACSHPQRESFGTGECGKGKSTDASLKDYTLQKRRNQKAWQQTRTVHNFRQSKTQVRSNL